VTDQPQTFQQHPTDPGNDYAVAPYPTSWIISTAHVPLSRPDVLEEVLVITWRVGPATLTVMLPRPAAQQVHADLSKRVRGMSSLVVPGQDGRRN
jgi:hypothetical protein